MILNSLHESRAVQAAMPNDIKKNPPAMLALKNSFRDGTGWYFLVL
jgi:hypothetical protein